MHSSNPPPLNTSFSSVTPPRRSSSVVFEPYALHILSSIIKDLQFLRQQGYITITALDEIIEKLPKPVPHATPHTPPPALSPSASPRSKSPAVSVKSDTSQKRISNFIAPQRPLSAPSEISPQQEQERSLSHPLAQIEPIVEVEVKEGDQNQQSQQQSQQQQQQQQQQTKPLPITFPPPPPIQPQNDQNDQNDQIDQNDGVVNAGQPQLDNQSLITKPAVPSRLSVIIPQSNSSASSSTGTLGTAGGTGTTGGTGAILATRPLPLPPNASNSSPPRPQPLPVFNSKQEEAEYEKSMSFQVYKEQMLPALPAYSLSVVEAMWDFMSDDAGDLSFSKGDIIEVVEYVNADWWRGRIQRTNKIGIFPKVYTKIIPEQAMANNGYYSQQRITSQHSNNISAYTSQAILPYVQQSPSLQQQQLPIQQQLQLQTQQNYTAYQQQYVNQTTYLNSRSSTNSLNGQQQQFYRNL